MMIWLFPPNIPKAHPKDPWLPWVPCPPSPGDPRTETVVWLLQKRMNPVPPFKGASPFLGHREERLQSWGLCHHHQHPGLPSTRLQRGQRKSSPLMGAATWFQILSQSLLGQGMCPQSLKCSSLSIPPLAHPSCCAVLPALLRCCSPCG